MTTIGIIGAGGVGAGLATVLAHAGHNILLTNSDPGSDRLAQAADAAGATPVDAAAALVADLVILAAPYAASLEFAATHNDALAGKVLVDATNPLTANYAELTVSGDTSAAEQIAAAAPLARVVKAFNTVFSATYANAELLEANQFVPIAGDDAAAVETVRALAADIGFDAVPAGNLAAARFIEPTVLNLIHLGFFQGLGPNLGLSLVRA